MKKQNVCSLHSQWIIICQRMKYRALNWKKYNSAVANSIKPCEQVSYDNQNITNLTNSFEKKSCETISIVIFKKLINFSKLVL